MVVADDVAALRGRNQYGVVDAVVKHFEAMQKNGEKVAGQAIRDLVTSMVCASRRGRQLGPGAGVINKPELVVVSRARVRTAHARSVRGDERSAAHHPKSARIIRRFEDSYLARLRSAERRGSALFSVLHGRG